MRTFATQNAYICSKWCDRIYGASLSISNYWRALLFSFVALLPDEIENHHHFRLHFITFGFSLFILSRSALVTRFISVFLTVYSSNAFLHFSHVHFIAFFFIVVGFFFRSPFVLPFGFLGRFVFVWVCVCNFYVPQRVQYIALVALFDRRHVVCFLPAYLVWWKLCEQYGNGDNNATTMTSFLQFAFQFCCVLFYCVRSFYFFVFERGVFFFLSSLCFCMWARINNWNKHTAKHGKQATTASSNKHSENWFDGFLSHFEITFNYLIAIAAWAEATCAYFDVLMFMEHEARTSHNKESVMGHLVCSSSVCTMLPVQIVPVMTTNGDALRKNCHPGHSCNL